VLAANEKAPKSEKETSVAESKAPEYYVVQKGDNLSNIAKKYAVSIDDLKKWNNLSNGNIAFGLKLKLAFEKENDTINSDTNVVLKTEFKTQEYVVVKGDNLGNIAKKHKVSTDDLKLWNNLTDNNIQLGSTLIVAKTEVLVAEKQPKKDKSTSKAKEEHYYVQKGDSLYKIAKKYPGITVSDIKKWNSISNENLKPGMKLKISG
jgi:membrane-bound lytic murein transglycosylase D